MTLKDRIASDLKEAMGASDQVRLDTLRSALSGFTYKTIEAGRELSDADELEAVRKQVKQRSDSLAEFEKAGRPDLVEPKRAEREILSALSAGAEVGRRDPRDRPGGARDAAGGPAQPGRRDEAGDAAAQGRGRRLTRPPNRHRRARRAAGRSVTSTARGG